MVAYLRKNRFPDTIDSNYIKKKLELAPNNEARLIKILKFIKVIDENGKGTERGIEVFATRDKDFHKEFSDLIREAYSDLFDEQMGDDTWTLDKGPLIEFFRDKDRMNLNTAKSQAGTFQMLAAISGRREMPGKKARRSRHSDTQRKNDRKNSPGASEGNLTKNIGLTVRIEINLPSDGTKETYDAIFRSIKENLING